MRLDDRGISQIGLAVRSHSGGASLFKVEVSLIDARENRTIERTVKIPSRSPVEFFSHWLLSWLVASAAMLPVAALAAPVIRAVSVALTREE
jgi:hypothetical protein